MQNDNYTKRALNSSIVVVLFTTLSAVFLYLGNIFFARTLSVSDYGLFAAVSSFAMTLFIFRELGLRSAIAKFLPEYIIRKNEQAPISIFLFTLFSWIIISLILILLMIPFRNFLVTQYFKSPQSFYLFLVISAFIIVHTPSATGSFVFQGYQIPSLYSSIETMKNFIILVAGIILSFFVSSAFLPAYSYLIAAIVCFLFYSPFLVKVLHLRFKHFITFFGDFSHSSWPYAKKILLFGTPVWLASVSGLILKQLDVTILTYLESVDYVGIYTNMFQIANIVSFFAIPVSFIMLPLVSEMFTKKLNMHVRLLIGQIYKYVLIVVSLIMIAIFFTPGFLIPLFYTTKYLTGINALKILAITNFFTAIILINAPILLGLNEPKKISYITLLGLVLNFILNIILIPMLSFIGAALATLSSSLLMAVLGLYFIWKKTSFEFPLFRFGTVILLTAVIGYLLSGLYYLFISTWIFHFLFYLVLGIAFVCLIFLFKIVTITELTRTYSRYIEK